MHETLLLSLALLLAITLFVMLGQRLHISTPIFLVISGLILSLFPGLPPISVDPELIFLLFLPPLLYEAAWYMSWKELWRWRRIILVMAFGLVLFTATAVAYVSYMLIPGFTLALGFLLGGIISPPDAVAAESVLQNVSAPKRLMSLLRGESLINDASSLVVFRFALAAVLSGTFAMHKAAMGFVTVTLLGVGVGLGVAGIFYLIHRFLPTTTRINILLTFIAPYIMYLSAEEVGGSGVMAVVSGGLFLSYHSNEILDHTARLQGTGMWATIVFALNGLVFILIGLELPVIIRALGDYSPGEAIYYALIITFLLIVVRMTVALGASAFTQFIGRYITVAERNPGWRGPIVLGWAGMRGVVSLASALSVPLTLSDGSPFPHRNLILFITFVVILITLVFQGLTLPMVIRMVGVSKTDDGPSDEEQELRIRKHLLTAVLDHLDTNYTGERNELLDRLRAKVATDLHRVQLPSPASLHEQQARYNEIMRDLSRVKRQELRRLRNDDDFDDDALRKAEARIDLHEEVIDHPIRE
jgi:CPA1 family monovalent cation:H+ antiporter